MTKKKSSGRQAQLKRAKAGINPKGRSRKYPLSYLAIAGAIVGVVISLVLSSGGQTQDENTKDNSQMYSYDWPNHKHKTISQIKAEARKSKCADREGNDRCARMAMVSGCHSSPGWMSVMCAATCNSCELLNPEVRCDPNRIGYDLEKGYGPGDLGKMFMGLEEKYPQYNITYLSQPPQGPWVAQFDNFLSDIEIEELIASAGLLQRSTDQGGVGADGIQEQVISSSRTSENAWCMGECERNPVVMGVQNRIAEIVGVPSGNFESFQLLRYKLGQRYDTHHDMSPQDNQFLAGPRVLTFFLYLSEVEEGGGTHFPKLNITMMPKKGSAILWPSVLDENPTVQDRRTLHAALPVIKGTKYAANSWIHLYNYKIPNTWGCTGAFTT